MKTKYIIVTVIVLAVIGVLVWSKSSPKTETPSASVPSSSGQEASIKGCYVATNGQDVYTLNIQAQEDARASGLLSFKNFQKDSSSGTFSGSYSTGILLGDYSFKSEGVDSVMQVAFKKEGNNFVRGYGQMNVSGTQFVNPSTITYDSTAVLAVFKEEVCK